MEAARASDPKLITLRALVEQWRQQIGAERVTTRRLIGCATLMRTATAVDTALAGRQEFARPDLATPPYDHDRGDLVLGRTAVSS